VIPDYRHGFLDERFEDALVEKCSVHGYAVVSGQ
jgi:hypothetical protein